MHLDRNWNFITLLSHSTGNHIDGVAVRTSWMATSWPMQNGLGMILVTWYCVCQKRDRLLLKWFLGSRLFWGGIPSPSGADFESDHNNFQDKHFLLTSACIQSRRVTFYHPEVESHWRLALEFFASSPDCVIPSLKMHQDWFLTWFEILCMTWRHGALISQLEIMKLLTGIYIWICLTKIKCLCKQEVLVCLAKRYGIFAKARGYGRTLKDPGHDVEKEIDKYLHGSWTSRKHVEFEFKHIDQKTQELICIRTGPKQRLLISGCCWFTPWHFAIAASRAGRLTSSFWKKACTRSWQNQEWTQNNF